jgi:hypothetical protein
MSFAALLLIGIGGFVVALLGRGRAAPWVVGAIIVAVLFASVLGLKFSSRQRFEQAQADFARQQAAMEMQAVHQATQAAHESNARPGGPPLPWVSTYVPPTPSVISYDQPKRAFLFAVVAVIAMIAFAVRRVRREGDAKRSGVGIVFGVLGFLMLGLFWLRANMAIRTSPSIALSEADSKSFQQEAESFFAPRIKISSSEPEIVQETDQYQGAIPQHEHVADSHADDHEASAHATLASSESAHGHETPASDSTKAASASATGTATSSPSTPAPSAAASDQPKPAWTSGPSEWYAQPENATYVVVQAGPYSTIQECYEQLKSEMRQAVGSRIMQLVREEMGRSAVDVPALEQMHLGTTYIESNLVDRKYLENGEASFGPTKTAWALLRFDGDDDQRLIETWKVYARVRGVKNAVTASALVLAVLASIFALLKVDTVTRGYYSKRLFLGVPAAIIAVVLLASLLGVS